MTKELAEKVCSLVTIGRGGFEGWLISLEAFPSDSSDDWHIDVSCQLPHRDTGVLTPVCISVWASSLLESSPDSALEHALERVRLALVSLVTHEITESLLVDGVRRYDPHPLRTPLDQQPPPT
jgi:hypothetical protein